METVSVRILFPGWRGQTPGARPPFRCSRTVLLRGGICSPDIEESIHKCIVGDQWKSVGVFELYVRSIPELGKDGKRRRGGKNQKTDGGCSPAQRETPEGHAAESVRQLSSGGSAEALACTGPPPLFPLTSVRIHGAIS